MARGRIQNRALLQAASRLLNIEGVKQFPAELDLGDIKAVFDVGSFMAGNAVAPIAPTFTIKENHSGNFPANTLSCGVNLIGSRAAATINPASVGGDVAASVGVESRILSISANVGYVAAGAAADAAAGAKLIAMVILDSGVAGAALAFPIQDQWMVVENVSPYGFTWTFPHGKTMVAAAQSSQTGTQQIWDGHVPPGWSCWFQLTRQGGVGFFPALTSLDTYFHVAQRPARGDWKA